MIDFDDLRGKAEEFLEDHADQIDKGIDKAAGVAGKKYGHGSQIEQGADKLKDLLPGGDEQEAAPQRGTGGRHAQQGQHGRPGPRQGAPGGRKPDQRGPQGARRPQHGA